MVLTKTIIAEKIKENLALPRRGMTSKRAGKLRDRINS